MQCHLNDAFNHRIISLRLHLINEASHLFPIHTQTWRRLLVWCDVGLNNHFDRPYFKALLSLKHSVRRTARMAGIRCIRAPEPPPPAPFSVFYGSRNYYWSVGSPQKFSLYLWCHSLIQTVPCVIYQALDFVIRWNVVSQNIMEVKLFCLRCFPSQKNKPKKTPNSYFKKSRVTKDNPDLVITQRNKHKTRCIPEYHVEF